MQICSPFGQGGSTQLRLSAWRQRGGYTAWSRTNLCSLIGTKRGVHADLLSVWPWGEYTAWNQLSFGFLSEFAKRPVFGLWPEVGGSNPPLSLRFGPRGGYKALFSACNTKGGVHSSFLSLYHQGRGTRSKINPSDLLLTKNRSRFRRIASS
jgi:hypothetical protein